MSKATNSGVHALSGFEFQKYCALVILLENFNTYRQKNFFICIEHHDDLIFGFLNDRDQLEYVDSYQAKKSGKKWGLDSAIIEVFEKMTVVGDNLCRDQYPKSNAYCHKLYFGTNSSVELKVKKDSVKINVSNCKVNFKDFPKSIQTKIENDIKVLSSGAKITELNNVAITYFDLGQSSQSQLDQLVGAFSRVFGEKVKDHRAAVTCLINLFREVELVLNQNNNAKFMDVSKRVTSDRIIDVIEIIETQQMAFKLWRENGVDLAKKLSINIFDRRTFEFKIQSSFDLFKDAKQLEHIKILKFVKDNKNVISNHTDEVECVEELYNSFIKTNSSGLPELDVKAGIIAAFVEVREAHA